jgi:hypothetical protein
MTRQAQIGAERVALLPPILALLASRVEGV